MKMKLSISILVILMALASCQSNSKKEQSNSNAKVSISAAGATFPLPFYNMVFSQYTQKSGIQITYGGIGSGGGIRSLTDKVVDFGATDAYLEDDKLKDMAAEVVHVPTCMGAVVIAYNIPGVDGIQLSESLLEKIFMGDIKNWNHPEIKAENSTLQLPNQAISVVYRSDGSGTTHIFSDYMSKISPRWAEQIGTGKALNWLVGMGAKGNPGVAGTISSTVGSVGYIGSEFSFAMKIQTAKLRNSSGNFVEPTIESISAAAQGTIPEDTRVMLTNSDHPDAYPICGFTWLILYKEQAYNKRSLAQATETLKLLNWMLSDEAQSQAEKVHYAPLPEAAAEKAKNILQLVTYESKPLLK